VVRALRPPDVEVAGHPVELLGRHDRPDHRLRVEAVADPQPIRELGDPRDELFVDRPLDVDPGASAADLPGVGEHAHRRSRYRAR